MTAISQQKSLAKTLDICSFRRVKQGVYFVLYFSFNFIYCTIFGLINPFNCSASIISSLLSQSSNINNIIIAG